MKPRYEDASNHVAKSALKLTTALVSTERGALTMSVNYKSYRRSRDCPVLKPNTSVISQWWHDRRRDTAALTIAMLVALAIHAAPTHAQVYPDDFSIAGSIAGGVGAAAQDFTDLIGATILATAEIEDARRQFWATYPDRPGFSEASARFAHALWQKDQLYMMGFLIEGPPEFDHYEPTPSIFDILGGRAHSLGSGQRNLAELLLNLAGGVDGGIDPDAQRWFFEWVRAVRRGMGARNDRELILFNPFQYPAALAEAQDAYERYTLHRDAGEMWMGPYSPLLAEAHPEFLAAVLARLGTPYEDAAQQARMLAEFVGPDALAEAIRTLRLPGEDPRQISRMQWERRRSVLHGVLRDNVRDDARGFLARIYLPRNPAELPHAMDHIQSLFAEFGESDVLQAAERIRVAPTRVYQGSEAITDFSGHDMMPATWWLLHLLENPDATLPTRTEAYYVDAANAAHIQMIIESGTEGFAGGLRFVGTVTHASPTPDDFGVFLHLAGTEDMLVRMHPRLQRTYGSNAERIVGETVRIRPSLFMGRDSGRFQVLVQTPEQLSVADAPIQPVRTLPARQAERVRPGPPNRENVEAAYLERLRVLFDREDSNLMCSMPHGEHLMQFRLTRVHVGGDRRFPRQATLRLQTNFRLETGERVNTGPLLETVRSASGQFNQSFRMRELDWNSASVDQADGDCLVLRVPVSRPGQTVEYRSSTMDGSQLVEEERAEFELRITAGSGAAERIVDTMRAYVASDVEHRSILRDSPYSKENRSHHE